MFSARNEKQSKTKHKIKKHSGLEKIYLYASERNQPAGQRWKGGGKRERGAGQSSWRAAGCNTWCDRSIIRIVSGATHFRLNLQKFAREGTRRYTTDHRRRERDLFRLSITSHHRQQHGAWNLHLGTSFGELFISFSQHNGIVRERAGETAAIHAGNTCTWMRCVRMNIGIIRRHPCCRRVLPITALRMFLYKPTFYEAGRLTERSRSVETQTVIYFHVYYYRRGDHHFFQINTLYSRQWYSITYLRLSVTMQVFSRRRLRAAVRSAGRSIRLPLAPHSAPAPLHIGGGGRVRLWSRNCMTRVRDGHRALSDWGTVQHKRDFFVLESSIAKKSGSTASSSTGQQHESYNIPMDRIVLQQQQQQQQQSSVHTCPGIRHLVSPTYVRVWLLYRAFTTHPLPW